MHSHDSSRLRAQVARQSLYHPTSGGLHKAIGVAVVSLLVAGCAQTGAGSKAQQPVGPCHKLSIVQDGRAVDVRDGTFQLARRPFTIRYTGPETAPALAASSSDRLVNALHQRGRSYLWASAGDYMGYVPNDLGISRDFKFYADERERNDFASMIGDGYPELLKELVQKEPGNDIASFIPKVDGDFEREASGSGYAFEVRSIGGTPMAGMPFSKLYVTYFGTVDQFQPPGQGAYSIASLMKLNWGACVLSFAQ